MTVNILDTLIKEHPESFALEGEPLSATPYTQYSIPTGDALPVRKRAYRIAECQKEPLRKIIAQLREEGVIRPSRSAWSAPVLLVAKKSGGYRLVIITTISSYT